jgi:hypothetical protein
MARGTSVQFARICGKLGDSIYFRGQHHAIQVRAKTDPVQPDTPEQVDVRTAFAAAAGLWNTITEAQRQGWHKWAKTLKTLNPIDDIAPDGRIAFLGVNSHRNYMILAGPVLTPGNGSPPTSPGWLPIPTFEVVSDSAGQQGFRVRWTYSIAEDQYVTAVISPPFTITRNRYTGPWNPSFWRRSSTRSGDTASTNFRGLTVGKYYFVYYRAVSRYNPVRFSHTGIFRALAVQT